MIKGIAQQTKPAQLKFQPETNFQSISSHHPSAFLFQFVLIHLLQLPKLISRTTSITSWHQYRAYKLCSYGPVWTADQSTRTGSIISPATVKHYHRHVSKSQRRETDYSKHSDQSTAGNLLVCYDKGGKNKSEDPPATTLMTPNKWTAI